MAKLDRMGKTRAKRAALERKNSNVGATQMTKIAKTEATRREATNSLFPPFVSKSAWRSNLTDSLSHNYRERPIAAFQQ
jgi:hypothetical protein